MRKDGDTVTYSAEELDVMRSRGESRTDWNHQRRLTDEEIERAAAADPDWQDVPRDWYEAAEPFFPRAAKRQITLRLDPDVLDWFKAQGPGYQTRINAALRAFVHARTRAEREG